jgi:HEPN domain-containing protein
MDKQTEVKQWYDIADKDMAAAIHLAKNMYPPPVEIICFHCQQAAEKYLKLFLRFHDSIPPKIHDLEELEKRCEIINPQFSALFSKCSRITGYGAQARYPGDIDLDEQDMNTALVCAKDIIAFVQSTLPDLFPSQQGAEIPEPKTD